MDCCKPKTEKKQSGFLRGLCYGLTPHIFCIMFAVFTIIGSTALTTLLKPLLLNPYFFYFLIALSFVFATISAVFYLKRAGILSFEGAKRKWKYLTVLYGTTISVNLLFFMVIFPVVANFNPGGNQLAAAIENTSLSSVSMEVAIPCSGHAPLIITELNKVNGVAGVKFKFPNLFQVTYDSSKASLADLVSPKVFQEYQATILK